MVEGYKPQDFSFFHRSEKLVQQSQFYCVGNSRATLQGESLCASTGPAGQALSPPSWGWEDLGERWSPFFDAKEGDGGWFSKSKHTILGL